MKGKEIIFALSILALPAPTLAGTPKMIGGSDFYHHPSADGLAAPHQENQLRL